MRFLVDHLRVHAVDGSEVVDKFALLLRHMRQDLAFLVRREETDSTRLSGFSSEMKR